MIQLPLYPEDYIAVLAEDWLTAPFYTVESFSEYMRRHQRWNRSETRLWQSTGHIPIWWRMQYLRGGKPLASGSAIGDLHSHGLPVRGAS